jgi:hypothetical protein
VVKFEIRVKVVYNAYELPVYNAMGWTCSTYEVKDVFIENSGLKTRKKDSICGT